MVDFHTSQADGVEEYQVDGSQKVDELAHLRVVAVDRLQDRVAQSKVVRLGGENGEQASHSQRPMKF